VSPPTTNKPKINARFTEEEYLETGAIEEAVRIFKYYTKRQKPQLQEDYHQ
jgi:hypothetical protein